MFKTSSNRRKFNSLGLLLLGTWLTTRQAQALTLSDISQNEALKALRATLDRGARSAISQLGRTDGFLRNERVRIPLPRQLDDAQGWLRRLGQGERLDELITSMNRAAEDAVPQALGLMEQAVRQMTVADARKILSGGDTAVTDFFAEKTRTPLAQRFLPAVSASMARIGVAQQYNQLASRAADYGLMAREDASIEKYVTGKSLDGLYLVIGDEERKIRRDPVGTGSALLGKVFGALR